MEKVSDKNLLEDVREQSLMEFTKEIAKEVRLSGTEEEFRAFQYAEKQLKSFGFQTNLYKRMGYVSHPGESILEVNGKGYQSITHAMAPQTPKEGVTSQLVYVGEGTDQNYSEIDVSGKIVLIEGLAIPGQVMQAEKFGAIAAVFINAEYTHEMIVSTVWGNPDLKQSNDYPKIPVVSVNYSDGQKIIEDINSKEVVNCFMKTKVETKWCEIPMLEADYKAKNDSDSYVLFSGHIDSWHYGVMDNGTANATMLEIARVIGENKLQLNRSLKLAFWSGHSHGRYAGSARYVDEHWEDLYDHCIAHINIDSVGGKNSYVLSEGNAMAGTKEIIAQSIGSIAHEDFNSTRYGRSGDQSFWGPGVPSLLMGLSEQRPDDSPVMKAFSKLFGGGKGGGFGWWWHTTEDTIDKIDPELLVRDCKIYLSIILELCSSPIIPFDPLAEIEDVEKTVNMYAGLCESHNGLQTAKKRITEAKRLIVDIQDVIKGKDTYTEDQVELINCWLMDTTRVLVRINYVNDDEFNHDKALGQPAVPLLADVLKFTEDEADSYNYIVETSLTRKANKFNFIVRELISDLKEWLVKLEQSFRA